MRKVSLLGVSLVVAITMLGLMASGASAISKKTWEWCYANRTCYGIVNITRTTKTWTYRVGMTVEDHGSYTKAGGYWIFRFQNVNDEACEAEDEKGEQEEVHGHGVLRRQRSGSRRMEEAVSG